MQVEFRDTSTQWGGTSSDQRSVRDGRTGPPFSNSTAFMAEWKPSFERGISNFRSGKYEEALAYFNEV